MTMTSIPTFNSHSYPLSAELQLAVVEIDAQQSRKNTAANEIDAATAAQTRHREEAEAARERARDEAKKSGMFGDLSNVLGSDVATAAGIVAMGAATVATGGAALPAVIAAAALMAASKYGADHGWDPKLCAGLGLAGAGVGLASGNVGSAGEMVEVGATTAATAEAISAVAAGVQGAATIAGGATGIAAGVHSAKAQNARADAKHADASADNDSGRIDEAIGDMKKAQKNSARAFDLASKADQTRNANANAIIDGMRG
jgi:hypothetical protein